MKYPPIIVNLSGRGDKDVAQVAENRQGTLPTRIEFVLLSRFPAI